MISSTPAMALSSCEAYRIALQSISARIERSGRAGRQTYPENDEQAADHAIEPRANRPRTRDARGEPRRRPRDEEVPQHRVEIEHAAEEQERDRLVRRARIDELRQEREKEERHLR